MHFILSANRFSAEFYEDHNSLCLLLGGPTLCFAPHRKASRAAFQRKLNQPGIVPQGKSLLATGAFEETVKRSGVRPCSLLVWNRKGSRCDKGPSRFIGRFSCLIFKSGKEVRIGKRNSFPVNAKRSEATGVFVDVTSKRERRDTGPATSCLWTEVRSIQNPGLHEASVLRKPEVARRKLVVGGPTSAHNLSSASKDLWNLLGPT